MSIVDRITAPSRPRPVGRDLTLPDLIRGDVLLSRGDTLVSHTIVAMDGGSYSHAALWSGQGVIEASLKGIAENRPIGDRDVYRYAHGPLPEDIAARIVSIARSHVGLQYAYNELYLLGAMFAAGHRPQRSLVGSTLHALGISDAQALEDWLAGLDRQCVPRVCTELVAHAYYWASPGHQYAFRIRRSPLEHAQRPTSRGTPCEQSFRDQLDPIDDPTASSPELEELASHFESSALAARAHAERALAILPTSDDGDGQRKFLLGEVALSAEGNDPISVVTPADLQFSPSLTFVGRIRET